MSRLREIANLKVAAALGAVLAGLVLFAIVPWCSIGQFRDGGSTAKKSKGNDCQAEGHAPERPQLVLEDGEGPETQHLIAARPRHSRRRREEHGFSTYRCGELDLSADLVPSADFFFSDACLDIAAIANHGSQRTAPDSWLFPHGDLVELSAVCLRC